MHHQDPQTGSRIVDKERLVIVAVSGGSDSVALLQWVIQHTGFANIHVATVDHGLRSGSALEARFVADMARGLGLPHKTLLWNHEDRLSDSKSAATARDARYHLLHEFAQSIGATIMMLGHTLDDQAETILMRTRRIRADSDTRGLSGMSEWSTLHRLKVWRPLLNRRRHDLQQDLVARKMDWIDDPTNQDTDYERVRTRLVLADNEGNLPRLTDIARLASLSARSRRWMNARVAQCLNSDVRSLTGGALQFTPKAGLPLPILLETMTGMILVCGGLAYRSPTSKITDFAGKIRAGTRSRMTLGRCLIVTSRGLVTVQREDRNLPRLPDNVERVTAFDGRLLLHPAGPGNAAKTEPYIRALETFRAAADDPLHDAVMRLLSPRSGST